MNTELEKPVSEANTNGHKSLTGRQPQADTVEIIYPGGSSVYTSDKKQVNSATSELERARLNKYHQAAQICLAAGMFPLPKTPGEKKPDVCYKDEYPGKKRPSSERLTRYWEDKPDSELCFLTGSRSNYRLVIDIDPRHGGIDSLSELEEKLGILPATQTALTGRGDGGTHYHYTYPKGTKIGCFELAPGIHVKADGGMCVLPPSLHPDTGKPYTWAPGHGLGDIDAAEIPEAWLNAIMEKDGTRNTTPSTKGKRKEGYTVKVPLLGTPPACLLADKDIKAFYFRKDIVPALCSALGIPRESGERIGKKFCCVLPGHEEHRPSASLYVHPSGLIVYKDFHEREGKGCLTLPEVRAAQAYGQLTEIGKPEYAVWSIRLLVEAGVIDPAPVDSLILPSNVRPSVRKVWDGFRLLLGCKWLHSHGDPTPFTRRFASNWCGLAERHTVEAVKQLLRMGMMEQVGSMHAGGRSLMLFLPGKRARFETESEV